LRRAGITISISIASTHWLILIVTVKKTSSTLKESLQGYEKPLKMIVPNMMKMEAREKMFGHFVLYCNI